MVVTTLSKSLTYQRLFIESLSNHSPNLPSDTCYFRATEESFTPAATMTDQLWVFVGVGAAIITALAYYISSLFYDDVRPSGVLYTAVASLVTQHIPSTVHRLRHPNFI